MRLLLILSVILLAACGEAAAVHPADRGAVAQAKSASASDGEITFQVQELI